MVALYQKACAPTKEQGAEMLRLIYVNHQIENGDFHLRKAVILRAAEPTLQRFTMTRLSPAFGIMNTRYFSDFDLSDEDRGEMLLAFRGHKVYSREDFHVLGLQLGLPPSETDSVLHESALNMARAAQSAADRLPALLESTPEVKAMVLNAFARASNFCRQDFTDIPRFIHPQTPSSQVEDGVPNFQISDASKEERYQSIVAGFGELDLIDSLRGLIPDGDLAALRARAVDPK